MTTFRRSNRIRSRLLAVVIFALAANFALSGKALANDGPQIATASTQDLLPPVPRLTVIWHGKRVSALPFRIRVLDQASPLAYSLDIRRPVKYGDSWTGVSLGSPSDPEARSLPSVGISDPLLAEAIARGDVPASKPLVPVRNNAELAARQIAIWSATNNLRLTRRTVPDAALRARARQLIAGAKGISVPLQSASHSVQIFVQDTSATTVQLAVTIGLDANTHSTTPQNIDLYLDGVRCPIRTQALTHIELGADGTYHADKPQPFDSNAHSTDVADVDLDRNTKVVDATANWVNVISDPGLVMAGAGAAPPLVTAESATLNFTSTTRLDPSDYTNPGQLLSNAGTDILTKVPAWATWVVLILALYLLSRAGRLTDLGFKTWWSRRRKSDQTVDLAAVEVEAATEGQAVRTGLLALNLTKKDDVVVTVLPSAPGLTGTSASTRVRLARRSGKAQSTDPEAGK
jgi:hypothetical protein